MRVLVTGATGFVGSHLVPALAAAGHDVLALGHDERRIASGEGVRPIVVDLRRGELELPEVDAIVHLAQANVQFPDGAADLLAVNAVSTARLLDHARRVGAERFVLASSASVYGAADGPVAEDDELRARDFYAATKIAAERFVDAYAGLLPGTTTMRLVAPYGPGQHGRLIPRLVDRVRAAEPVVLNRNASPRLNPVFVGDVVRVVLRALDVPGHRVVNVAGDDVVDVRKLASLIGEALGVEPRFEETDQAAADVVARNDLLKRELGIGDLVPLADGLLRTVSVEAVA
jgi:nucleoside-diphosphate-sugar epimerase